MEFTEDQWFGLARHAREKSLLFLSSPFSTEAVDLLERIDTPMWKVASGEVGNLPLLDRMISTGKPIILSSGMSDLAELDRSVARVQGANLPLAVLQCTTAYPCPPERIGLNLVPFFRERYGCFVGLSDHSGTIYPGLANAAIGGDVLEVHVTMSRGMFGPDVPASVTIEELRVLVTGVRFIETMRANPVEKDTVAKDMAPLRAIFTKSVVARVPLPKGTVIDAVHLAAKKPGTGLPADRQRELVGRRLRRAIAADEQVRLEDLEEKV
jgi:N-acetylneuraminate synthase